MTTFYYNLFKRTKLLYYGYYFRRRKYIVANENKNEQSYHRRFAVVSFAYHEHWRLEKKKSWFEDSEKKRWREWASARWKQVRMT